MASPKLYRSPWLQHQRRSHLISNDANANGNGGSSAFLALRDTFLEVDRSFRADPLLPSTSQANRPSVVAAGGGGGGSSNGSGGSNNTSKTEQSSHSRESGFLSAASLNADVSPASTLTGKSL